MNSRFYAYLRVALVVTLATLWLVGGAAAEAPGQLQTVRSGSVSGDVYVKAYQPVPWGSQPASGVTSREFTQAFALPAGATGSNVAWARLYVSVYSGSASADWPLRMGVTFDGNGDGTYETALGTETMQGIGYSTDGTVRVLNDHCNRVYSDYLAWYDVSSVIGSRSPAVRVTTEQVGSASYDGRLKAVALVVAYNDGDGDQVRYWVNQGHAWINTGTTATTFDTATVPAGVTVATLSNLALSSRDGTYSFNGNALAGANPVSPVNYFEHHAWDVTDGVTPGAASTLSMGIGSDTFKTVLAVLAVRSPAATPAPVAVFSADDTTPDVGQTVTFTDDSENDPTTWAWTIEGTVGTDYQYVDATSSSSQHPHVRFLKPGTYDVSLTATNAEGSDTETKTGYITVTAPVVAPVAAFSGTPTSGTAPLTVQFTDTSTGTITGWSWDFGDGETATTQSPSHEYRSAGTYTVNLTVTGPGRGADSEIRTDYITVDAAPATIEVSLSPSSVQLGTMNVGTPGTGSTLVTVETTGGTGWSVTASASSGGFMSAGSTKLSNAIELANGTGPFHSMTSAFTSFMIGGAGGGRTDTANLRQTVTTADASGDYAITITFTGSVT